MPYLAGERTPINDPDARGAFFGLKLSHTRAHLYRAGLEGVAYSINQHVRIFEEDGVPVRRVMAAGGGTQERHVDADRLRRHGKIHLGSRYRHRRKLWRCDDGGPLARGCWSGFEELARKVRPGITFEPNMGNHVAYERFQAIFDELYPATKDLMHRLSDDRTFHASHTVIDRRSAMLWTDKMFGTKKPIISMLHLDPLPGDPRYGHGGGDGLDRRRARQTRP